MDRLKELNILREERHMQIMESRDNREIKRYTIERTVEHMQNLNIIHYNNRKFELIACDEKYKNIHKNKANKIIIICPFSRPQFTQNVIDNFLRQKFENKILIIIENKDAIGKFSESILEDAIILNSEPGQAQAKNKGLEYIRYNFPGEFWTTFDDDDYYGENYLSELAENSDKSQVIGKLNTFMLDSDKRMKLLEFGYEENDFVKSIWGWSISSWVQDIDFPLLSCGEDNAWLDQIKMFGMKIYATSKYNACYNRSHGNNTWKVRDEEIYGECKHVQRFKSFDKDIVDNKVQFDSAVKKRC